MPIIEYGADRWSWFRKRNRSLFLLLEVAVVGAVLSGILLAYAVRHEIDSMSGPRHEYLLSSSEPSEEEIVDLSQKTLLADGKFLKGIKFDSLQRQLAASDPPKGKWTATWGVPKIGPMILVYIEQDGNRFTCYTHRTK